MEDKAFYVKVSPRTELYQKVDKVAVLLDIKLTQAARLMMRNGYLGFRRFLIDQGYEVKE